MAKKKRSKKRRIIIAAVCAAAVAAGAVWAVRGRTNAAQNASSAAQVRSALVTTGSITTTVVGSGTLARDDAEDVRSPSGLTVDTVLVESGDSVKEGQVLATVTKESVASAIADIQDSISSIDTQLAAIDENTEDKDVTAVVSGRVKEINISSGTAVADADDPVLMTLSVDGNMAVDLTNTSGVSEGDKVTVTVSGGSAYTGTCESVSGNKVTITLTDNGPTYGDTVSVADQSGNALGSGKLYIHQPLEITASSGTVSRINVSLNQKVSQGDVLFKLTGVRDTETEDELLAKRLELTDELADMLDLTKTLSITAPCDGTVVDVDVTAGSAATGSSSQTTASSSSTENGVSNAAAAGFSLSSYTKSSAAASGIKYATAEKSSVSSGAQNTAGNKNAVSSGVQHAAVNKTSGSSSVVLTAAEAESTDENEGSSDAAAGVSGAAGSAASSGSDAVRADRGNSSSETANGGTITDASIPLTAPTAGTKYDAEETLRGLDQALANAGYTVSEITWTDAASGNTVKDGDSFEKDHAYQAEIVLDAGNNTFSANCALTYDTSSFSLASRVISGDMKNITVVLNASKNASSGSEKTDPGTNSDGNQNGQDGNTPSVTPAVTQAAEQKQQIADYYASGGSGSGSGLSLDAATGTVSSNDTSSALSGAADSTSAAAASAASDLYSGGEVTAFTIASDAYMVVSINVDELDILSVKEGQSVSVALEALDGQTFDGTVSKVSDEGTNSGGSTKFKVTVRVPKNDSMLVGMTATATVTVADSGDVLTLPASAVQTRGSSSYVYTAENEDGSLAGETEVTTGASDGSTVEIKSGLSEGDTVYYTELAGSTISASTDNDMTGMMGGGGGGQQGGGDMPSGGGPGGNGNGGPGGN